MIQIEGSVDRTELALRRPIEPITSGCRSCIFLHLRFSKEWHAYRERWVNFRTCDGKHCCVRISENGICAFPEEALLRGGSLFLSVIGIKNGGGARVVTETASLIITESGFSAVGEVV